MKRNIADQKLDKTTADILLNNQDKASMHWGELTQFVDPSLQSAYLRTVIESTYMGNNENFYKVLDFLTRNELYEGYPILYKDIEMNRELHSGQEIFALAYMIKSLCGTNNELYLRSPKVVREILESPVILKNVENGGYIIASEVECKTTNNYTHCPSPHRFKPVIMRLQESEIENLANNPSAQWQFFGPSPSNVTELVSGFYIKNQNLFFVFHQRPPTASLRQNITAFGTEYGMDLHDQFEPALIPNSESDSNLIRIGVRQRRTNTIEYFRGGEWVKRSNTLDLSRIPVYKDEVKGFEWEVTPVNNDRTSNVIQGTEVNEKCSVIM